MIYADDRENEKLLHRLFVKVGDQKNDPKGQCAVKRLSTADYIISEYGIEAKEIRAQGNTPRGSEGDIEATKNH